METVKHFIEENGIGFDAVMIDKRPDGLLDDMPKGSNHWKTVISHKRHKMTVYFSQGPAICHDPSCEDVLNCCASDAQSCADSFEDFCGNMGYDTDSRKAEKIFKACQKMRDSLDRLLGDGLASKLIYETERL